MGGLAVNVSQNKQYKEPFIHPIYHWKYPQGLNAKLYPAIYLLSSFFILEREVEIAINSK